MGVNEEEARRLAASMSLAGLEHMAHLDEILIRSWTRFVVEYSGRLAVATTDRDLHRRAIEIKLAEGV
jgi:rRNA-processing protein FCF1